MGRVKQTAGKVKLPKPSQKRKRTTAAADHVGEAETLT